MTEQSYRGTWCVTCLKSVPTPSVARLVTVRGDHLKSPFSDEDNVLCLEPDCYTVFRESLEDWYDDDDFESTRDQTKLKAVFDLFEDEFEAANNT